jgi:hypothetical protein
MGRLGGVFGLATALRTGPTTSTKTTVGGANDAAEDGAAFQLGEIIHPRRSGRQLD